MEAATIIECAVAADDMRGLRDGLCNLISVLSNSASRYVSEAVVFLRHRQQVDQQQACILADRLVIVLRHLEVIVCVLEQLACATDLLEKRERAVGD